MEPIADKFAAFGWNTVIDGNDIDAVLDAVSTADGEKGRPTVVVARTTKAKSISFLEGTPCLALLEADGRGELGQAEREVHARIDNLREWSSHGS